MPGIDNKKLNEIRQRMQESLSEAKKEKLRTDYGMQFEETASGHSLDEENEWLDYLLDFEQQFEQAKIITVRERIGNPPIKPLNTLPLYAVGDAITSLLELLADHGIAVDFLGNVDEIEVYRYLTEEMLDEEIEDIHIKGMTVHFTYSTPENDVEMWVENFVFDLFTQERDYFLPGLEKQPIFNMQGEPITAAQFQQKIESVWEHLPPTNKVEVEPIVIQVDENEAKVWATISWDDEVQKLKGQVESYFRLQPSSYTGWNVVETSLLDDLLG